MQRDLNNTLSLRLKQCLLPVVAATLTACATTSTTSNVREAQVVESSSRVEVEEAVGFTIVEEGKVSADVRARYVDALARLEQGDHAAAVDSLAAITEEAPHLSAPLVDLGVEQHRAGELEAAEETLRLAIEAAPEHPVAHNELGIVYRKLGRFRESREHYEAALAVYPGYHYARRNLAVLCDLYLEDFDCALENYEAYLVQVPDDEEASMWVAAVRLRMDQGG